MLDLVISSKAERAASDWARSRAKFLEVGTAFIASMLFAASCGETPLAPTASDRAPEISISGANLRSEYAREQGYLISPVLAAPERATRVGFMFDLRRDRMESEVHFEARGVDRFGRAGDWVPAELTWQENEIRVSRADLGMAAVEAQIRIPALEAEDLAFVLWSAVVPMESDGGPVATLERGGIQRDRRGLSGGLAAGGVHSRADWGARATQCSTQDTVKTRMAVHHTVTPADASGGFESRIRGIQAYHMDSNGWCDIGYTFMVTIDGSLWEARPAIYLGAHVANNNSNNLGVSFIGCFHPGDATCEQPEFQPTTPPEAMIQGGGRMLGLLATEYGISINDNNVLGHRDHSGAQTSCPGNALHAELGRLRDLGRGVNPGPVVGSARGVVWDLSRTPGPNDAGNVRITNATITCSAGVQAQARDGDAYWTFDLEPGLYTFTAEAPGFAPATKELMVTAGAEVWGSFGLTPEAQAIEVGVHVTDASGAAVEAAEVSLGTIGVALTTADGRAVFTAPSAGSGTLTVKKEGFVTRQSEVAFSASTTVEVVLARTVVAEPGKPDDRDPPVVAADPMQRGGEEVPTVEEKKGCACTAAPTDARLLLLIAGAALLILRRRRPR